MATARNAASPKGGAAARAEARDESKTLEFEGLTLTLPAKMPFRVLKHLGAEQPGPAQVLGILAAMLGDDQLEQVFALDIDMDRGGELVELVSEQYGVDAGNSAASQDS